MPLSLKDYPFAKKVRIAEGGRRGSLCPNYLRQIKE